MPVEGRSIGRTFTAPDGTMTERVEDSNGVALTSWEEALDELDADPEAQPAVVMRFGSQVDIQGIIATSRDADRAIRYLTKYLTKAVAETYTNPDHEAVDDGYEAHIERSAGRPSGCTTCGSRAPLCGWAPAPTPQVVQRILGHASAAMTMDLYGHLIDHNLWSAAEKIGGTTGAPKALGAENDKAPGRGSGPLTRGFGWSRLSCVPSGHRRHISQDIGDTGSSVMLGHVEGAPGPDRPVR